MIFDIFAKEKEFYKGVILPVSSDYPTTITLEPNLHRQR